MDASALEILDPERRVVAFRGKRLEVAPLTIGQLPKLVRIARPVVDAVMSLDHAPSDDGLVEIALGLLADHGDALPVAIGVAVGEPSDWIAGGDPAEFLDLAVAVFEVNRDFFAQKLGPRLQALRAGGAPAPHGAGPTPSSSSPSGGTH